MKDGPTYRAALRRPEFAGLYAARMLSDWGDLLARVAIAALVLHRSGSAFYAACVFAISFLPKVFGQALLGPVADRLPRRTVMVVCDVGRALALVALVLAVIAGLPTTALLVLLFLVELAGAPFFGASRALLADVFAERQLYLRASSLMQVSYQFNQVAGVAVGGVVVTAVGYQTALWVDAATFAMSGVLIALLVQSRPAAATGGVPGLRELVADVRVGIDYLRRDVPIRSLMVLAWLMLLAFIAPEAVALPYAAELGRSTAAGAVLLAAGPLAAVISVLIVGRWTPAMQVRRLLVMATCVPLPLLGLIVRPGWAVTVVLFFVAGLFQGFMVPLMATFALLAPDELRGRLNGLAGSGFALVSALAFLVVGALADLTSPHLAVVLCASLTLLALGLTWLRWPRQVIATAAEGAYST